jgi:hypothetical protein
MNEGVYLDSLWEAETEYWHRQTYGTNENKKEECKDEYIRED